MFALLLKSPTENAEVIIRTPSSQGLETHWIVLLLLHATMFVLCLTELYWSAGKSLGECLLIRTSTAPVQTQAPQFFWVSSHRCVCSCRNRQTRPHVLMPITIFSTHRFPRFAVGHQSKVDSEAKETPQKNVTPACFCF